MNRREFAFFTHFLYNLPMRKARTFLFLGVWVAVLPYLGFPHSWKNILFSLSGLFLAYLGYILQHDEKLQERKNAGGQNFDNFKENGNPIKKDGEIF